MGYELENKIIDALAGVPLDYNEQIAFIREEKKKKVKWEKAGVLVLLGKDQNQSSLLDNYFFILNKRSDKVRQPGDLCFPGGHPNHWIDYISSRFIVPYILPLRRGPGFKMNKRIKRESFRVIMYFLSNVLRESFEEMRLNPFKVDFLGALGCYRLEEFHRLIFPIVGIMKRETKLKQNWEVEKVLRIAITSLFNHDKYAKYRLRVRGKFKQIFGGDWIDRNCFIHSEEGQQDEILWGATYEITMSFLKIAFSFSPPHNKTSPVIQGELYPTIS